MIPPAMQAVTGNPVQALGGLTSRHPKVGRAGSAPQYGMTMWFNVVVPDLDSGTATNTLGYWSGCSGLEVSLNPEGPYDEGGNYTSPRYLPGKISYGKVTLERAMTAAGSRQVRTWLERLAQRWSAGGSREAGANRPVTIELRSGLGRDDVVIHKWELEDAFPVSWTIPAFSSTSGGVAIEKLVLSHSGFLKRVEPVPECQLEFVEKGRETNRLGFVYNPAKISFSKSREAETKHARAFTEAVVVDPNCLKIDLSDLRLEGTEDVASAVSILDRWVELEQSSRPPARPPRTAEGTDPPTCSQCKQRLPSATDKRAPGKPRVLQLNWGQARGGMPKEMLLKKFDLNFVRFTPGGEPSRATVTLTLEEYRPLLQIGAHRR